MASIKANVFVMHQVGVVFEVVRFQASKNAFGRAVLQRRLIHDLHGLMAAAPREWMRAEDRRVPRLDGHDALEQNGRSGIGDRRERKDDPDRFCDFHDSAFRELADDADRTFVFHVVVDKLGRHHVLEGFVFQHPEPGFFNRQASQILSLLQPGQDHRLDDPVNVLLCELGKNGGGSSGLAHQSFEVSDSPWIEARFFEAVLIAAFSGRLDGNPLRHSLARDHYRPF